MGKLKLLYARIPQNLIPGLILAFIIGLAIILRFYQIDKLSFWYDELISAHMAHLDFNSFIDWVRLRDVHMILSNFLLWLWVRIFPTTIGEILRILPAIISVLSIPVVFLLGRAMVSDRKIANVVGLFAAFFVSINAYHIQYAQDLRAYSLVFLLTTLSTLLLVMAINKPNSKLRWFGYAVTITASIYSQFFAVLVLISQLFSLVILLRNKKFRFILRSVFGSFLIILVFLTPLILVAYEQRNLYNLTWIPATNVQLFLIFFEELVGKQGILLVILYLFLAVLGILIDANWKKGQKDALNEWRLVLIVSCFLLPIALTLLISNIRPIFWPRYLLLTLPYLAILAAMGLSFMVSLKRLKYRTFFVGIILIIFILLSGIGIKNYFENYQKEDFRGVAGLLQKRCMNSLRVYYPYLINDSVIYYNPLLASQLNWSSGLADIYIHNKPYSFKKGMEYVSNNYDSVCLTINLTRLYLRPKNQPLPEIQSFLQKKFPIVTKNNFFQFIVYFYSK